MPTEVLSPTASAHDAHEKNNNTDFQAGLTVIATVSTAVANDCYTAAVYLPNTIPQYAEIVSAAMEVWPVTNDDAAFIAFGHAALGVDFATNADVLARTLTRTLADVTVSQANLGTDAYKAITPDMAAVLQELVNSREWVDDTPFVLLLAGSPILSGTLYMASYDGDPNHAVKLTVEYQAPDDKGIALEELIHTMPTRALGAAIGVGDIMGAGDPSLFVDPDTGIKQMAFAGNRAGVTGIDMFIVPFDADTDDWDIDRSALLANVSETPIVTRPASPAWDSHRIESPSYVEGYDATNEVNVRRIYYVGGDTAGNEGPFEIGFLQWDGDSWERHGDPVLTATEDWEDWEGGEPFVLEPSVIYDAAMDPPWRMLYTAGDELNLAYADSQDGITWGNKAIFFASETFPAWSVTWAKVGTHYELVTSAISRPGRLARAWCATPSGTFADWSAFETLLDGDEGQKWHANWVYGPAIAEGDVAGEVWVYFTGRDDHWEATHPHIGRFKVAPMVGAGSVGLGAARAAFAVGG